MYFPEKILYLWIYLDTFMPKKIVIFWTILGVILIITNYYFLSKKDVVLTEKKTTIFTLEPLLGIHTKMIAGEKSIVIVWSGTSLNNSEKKSLTEVDIIIGSYPIAESPINKELQNYKGLYITLPSFPTWDILYDPEIIQSQIEIIRDALSDIDKIHHDYYHDAAGNYHYLLREMRNWLWKRIGEYHFMNFITIGENFDTLIRLFALEKYQVKNYKNIQTFLADSKAWEIIKSQAVQHIFINENSWEKNLPTAMKKYDVNYYFLPQIQEDTSNWWYLRHMEKVVNVFIRAFDTYD
jgi:ABC-type Zn uptake system ZnuABC Zn-binding protein ZnuA